MLEAGSAVMCCLRLGVVGADSTGLTLDPFSFLSYLIIVRIQKKETQKLIITKPATWSTKLPQLDTE